MKNFISRIECVKYKLLERKKDGSNWKRWRNRTANT